MSIDSDNELDQVLARFLVDLEAADDKNVVVGQYRRQYPRWANQFLEIADIGSVLNSTTEESEPSHPERLGDFRIVREIGGGPGLVYEAIQEPLGRRVAVKVIRHGRKLPAHRERFLREQLVLARLHQTHIVPIFAAGEAGPIQYYAMPWIEGTSLNHIVRAALQWETDRPDSKTPSVEGLVKLVVSESGDRLCSIYCCGRGDNTPCNAKDDRIFNGMPSRLVAVETLLSFHRYDDGRRRRFGRARPRTWFFAPRFETGKHHAGQVGPELADRFRTCRHDPRLQGI